MFILTVDAKTGLTSLDKDIAKLLYKTEKPVIVAVNKADNPELENSMYEFYELGPQREQKKNYIKVAFVGKPNAGKSSILNAILKEERVLVSDIPGTTRDTVDTEYRWKDIDFLFLDTAGMKKKKKVEYGVDFFSVGRSLESIKKADVVVLVIDATEGVTEQELYFISYAPILLVSAKTREGIRKIPETIVHQHFYFL